MNFTKKIFSVLISLCLLIQASIAQKTTVAFKTTEDSNVLSMDIYQPQNRNAMPAICVIFIFGGGFFTGARDYRKYEPYFKFLSDRGYVVASIDYRLGLKNAKKPPSLLNRKPLINSIAIAVEDLYSATNYLIGKAVELNIDTSKIIVSGSSAGAITALQGDYEKRNRFKSSAVLPENFEYAGVISFAGAVYSTNGVPTYKISPAPMLFFHGDEDDFVPYKKKSFFGTGIFGPASITKRLKKDDHFFCFYTFENIRHDASMFPMQEFLPEIGKFIDDYIVDKKPLEISVNIKNDNRENSSISFRSAYKKIKSVKD